jgi:hypothetical protein
LRGSGAHPLPVYFSIFKVIRNAEFSGIVIGFDPVGYDEFAGEGCSTFFI